MSSTVTLTTAILQGTTGELSFELVDESGAGIDSAQLSTMVLTYYDQRTEAILNSRQAQNVLNTNNVTIVTTGSGNTLVTTVTWALQPADTVIYDLRHELEYHVALFQWEWDSGARAGAHEVAFPIEQLTYA